MEGITPFLRARPSSLFTAGDDTFDPISDVAFSFKWLDKLLGVWDGAGVVAELFVSTWKINSRNCDQPLSFLCAAKCQQQQNSTSKEDRRLYCEGASSTRRTLLAL
eukprot:scaffold34608_cov172-Amphora_coffeaeformis.AAC.5